MTYATREQLCEQTQQHCRWLSTCQPRLTLVASTTHAVCSIIITANLSGYTNCIIIAVDVIVETLGPRH